MKTLSTFFLLALIPTFLLSSDSRNTAIHGLWYDDYTNTKLEIKHSRKGIKVKTLHGWFRKWRTYNFMGRGLYDDCEGRIIIVLDRNRIEWKRGRRDRPILLTRYGDYGHYNDYNRSRNRTYYNDRFDNRRNGGYQNSSNAYIGNWYCNDRGLDLTIEISGSGFRAISGNKWTYYLPFKDHYRDRRGNRYYLNDRSLTWRSADGKKNLRFGRR